MLLDQRHLRAQGINDQRICRNENRGRAIDEVQPHFRERAGQQCAVGIGHANFGLQRARNRVERPGAAHHFTVENAVRIIGNVEVGLDAGRDRARGRFGNIDVNAERVGLRDAIDFRRACGVRVRAGRRGDEVTHFDVAIGDRAGERRHDVLEVFLRGELPDVGEVGIKRRLRLGQRGVFLIGFFLRNGAGLHHRVPAISGRLRDGERGLRLLGGRLRLGELLVDLGRVDLGQRGALVHDIADVGVPLFHVTARARIDGGLLKSLHRAGQRQLDLRRGQTCDAVDDDALAADLLLAIEI